MTDKRLPADPNTLQSFKDLMELILSNPFMSYLDYDSLRIDLFETEQAYIVEAELIGYNIKDIQVEVFNQNLLLKAKKHVEKQIKDEQSQIFRSERTEEKIERLVDFPFNLHHRIISATFEQNILEVTIQKEGTVSEAVSIIPIEVK
ncbi:Hsp20/alpha crystallin family protein [Metabacillus iocasae]|uniref:HSP20 family protein n=1 Tax=Priestia iocasae TaxID=2291674 RepID=A0ABS2QX71_9BACI|nr:Hsp20/alpha crystallin family protein [Metabacillus iocasae]MBM7703788.1 HSP20 family protein [Metabacillus iocasae]